MDICPEDPTDVGGQHGSGHGDTASEIDRRPCPEDQTDKIYSLAWHLEARLMKTALAMALGFALKADA